MNGITPKQTLNKEILSDQQLVQRGIAQSAYDMAWARSQSRWIYPIYDFNGRIVTHRTKAYNNYAKYKYTWKPNSTLSILEQDGS